VEEVPPFLLAAIRFLIAGLVLYGWMLAVVVGYFFGGEALDLRTILGTFLVLAGVVVITTTPAKVNIAARAVEESG